MLQGHELGITIKGTESSALCARIEISVQLGGQAAVHCVAGGGQKVIYSWHNNK